MEKLIRKYKEECDLSSKLASRMWKIGQIIIIVIFASYYANTKELGINFIITIIAICVLHFICRCIESVSIARKMKIKCSVKEILLKKKIRKKIYQEFDIFQKGWITNFCKKNKINDIEKLKIVKEELDKRTIIIKYIDPIIIGTLLIAMWELILQKISEEIGIGNTILIGVFLVIIISIIVGWGKKEWKEQKEFMNLFNRYSGNERLKELLLYRILKL
jgi:hypothetical protein